MKMTSVEALQERVKALEAEVEGYKLQYGGPCRDKIQEMSSEVVDSNPYRLVQHLPSHS